MLVSIADAPVVLNNLVLESLPGLLVVPGSLLRSLLLLESSRRSTDALPGCLAALPRAARSRR